jgi:hypothetical protein
MAGSILMVLLLAIYVGGANDAHFADAGSPIGVLSGSHARLGARHSGSRTPMPVTPADRKALREVLEPDEHVQRVVPMVGSILVLTDRRLHLVRTGAHFRPRTGIRSWTLDHLQSIRLGPLRGGNARLAIVGDGISANAVVTEDSLARVEAVIAAVRSRLPRSG